MLASLGVARGEQAGAAPSDEDVWEFIVFLYGYDDEELAHLQSLSPEDKADYIAIMRQAKELKARNPKDFSLEEKEFYTSLRNTFRADKHELHAALAIGSRLTQEDLEKIVSMSKGLMSKCQSEAKSNRHVIMLTRGNPQSPIPAEWEFLNPMKIRAYVHSVEVQVYVNPIKPDGPQVVLTVLPDKHSDAYLVRYSTNISVGKSWIVGSPKTERKTSYGPR